MSNYRDDREAQRARAAALELELQAKNRELEELKGSEHAQERLDQLERDLAAAQAAVAALRQQTVPRRPSRAGPLVVAALVIVLGAVMGLVFLRSSPAPPPAPPPQARQPEPPAVQQVAPPPVPRPAAEPTATAAPTVEAAPLRTTATWRSKVVKADGLTLTGACSVSADLARYAGKIDFERVTVTCGDKKLYDSRDRLNGMAHLSHGAHEVRGDKRGTVRFAVAWEDKGERSATRSQVSIDSLAKSAAVWSTSAPAFHVDLSMDQRSASDAAPFLEESGRFLTCHTQTVSGSVAEVSGDTPAKKGQRCVVKLGPSIDKDMCSVDVACGGVGLFGHGSPAAASFAHIVEGKQLADAKPTTEDGDPTLAWTLDSDSLLVSDAGSSAYSVQIRLSPVPKNVLDEGLP